MEKKFWMQCEEVKDGVFAVNVDVAVFYGDDYFTTSAIYSNETKNEDLDWVIDVVQKANQLLKKGLEAKEAWLEAKSLKCGWPYEAVTFVSELDFPFEF